MKFAMFLLFIVMLIIAVIEREGLFFFLATFLALNAILYTRCAPAIPPPMIITDRTIRFPKWFMKRGKWIYRSILIADIVEIKRRYILMSDGKKYRFRAFYHITGKEIQRKIDDLGHSP